jgi:16S rRNA C967 or C1407 C5-methylase (RsmB/RsmF family)
VLWAENEAVVAEFLRVTTGAEDRTALLTKGWEPGAAGSAGPGYLNLPGAAGMDGFYYACLVKPA